MLINLVKPGVGETRASPSLPASMFSSDDFPTFDRPIKANSGSDSSGHEARSGALRSKMADEMFIIAIEQATVAANWPRGQNLFTSSEPARPLRACRCATASAASDL